MSTNEERCLTDSECLKACNIFMEYEDQLLQQVAVMGACLKRVYKLLSLPEPDMQKVRNFITIGTGATVRADRVIQQIRHKKNPGV